MDGIYVSCKPRGAQRQEDASSALRGLNTGEHECGRVDGHLHCERSFQLLLGIHVLASCVKGISDCASVYYRFDVYSSNVS